MNTKSWHKNIVWIALVALLLGSLACAAIDSLAGTGQPSTGSGANDAGDELTTTVKEKLAIGGPAGKGALDTFFDAHNWTFDGTAGQTVTIIVAGVKGSDPFVKLLDPDGVVLAEDDDAGGGSNAQLDVQLPVTGTYTIRIDMMETGEYTVAVR